MRQRSKKNSSSYVVEPLDSILEKDEDFFNVLLQNFSSTNADIENFIKTKAKQSSLLKNSVTYLVLDVNENMLDLVGYFTLSTKVLRVSGEHLSNTEKKKIRIFSYYDEKNSCYNCPAILLAQFGKNFNKKSLSITGDELMELALSKVYEVQSMIGGRVLFLECEQNQKLIDFYAKHAFKILGMPPADELLQMYKII